MSLRFGIDLGGTTIKLGLVNGQHQLMHRSAVPTQDDFGQAVEDITDAARRIVQEAGLGLSDLPFIGVGVPSTVHPRTGRIVFANNTGWQNAPLKEALQDRLGLAVLVANDADCALAGEVAAGAAAGIDNVLMLTLGTGVGGAMLLDGHLYSGADGMGMELGHMPIIAGGRPCTCGAEGCLEAYVSATGLIALTTESMAASPGSLMHQYVKDHENGITGRTAFDCAKTGDAAALKVIDRYCALLAQGIGGLVNIFRPQLVLIGGGISHAGDFLFSRLRMMAPRFILAHDQIGGPEIKPARLGNDAGIIGAAYLDRVQGKRQESV